MREDPGLDLGKVASSLVAYYGLRVASVALRPIGYDPNAAVYEVAARGGTEWYRILLEGPFRPGSRVRLAGVAGANRIRNPERARPPANALPGRK